MEICAQTDIVSFYEEVHLIFDMFGMRTPAKRLPSEGRTPPSSAGEKSVRLSIGEWEAAGTSATSAAVRGGSVKQLPLTQPQKQDSKTKASERTYVKTPTSPKRWPTGRVSEARACLNKGKLNLENSRNLKTEIKLGVLEALDRLYALVKEAEVELKKGKPTPETKGPSEIVSKPHQTETQQPPSPKQSKLVETLEEHSRLLSENNKKLQEIQDKIENQRELLERVSTYSSVAAKRLPTLSTLHSVVVTSRDETETGEEVLNKVRQTIDAKEGWIKVEKIRKAKDRKVIMGFGTKAERDKVKDRLGKDSTNLIVEDMTNKDPLLVLRSVLTINSDEDIVRALRNQNKDVFRSLDDGEDRIEVKYRRRARNPHTGHVVLSTSPAIWQRALRVGSLRIDLQRVRVEDQTPLVQCTRCLGYGHGKRYCRETVDLCSHCGGPHLRAECSDFLVDIPPKCRNCTKAGHERTEHNAFSAACPIRCKWDEIARAAVAYC